jgi:hypothetical protein
MMEELTSKDIINNLVKSASCEEEVDEYLYELMTHFENGVYLNLNNGQIRKIYSDFEFMLELEIPNISQNSKNAILSKTIQLFWIRRV